MMRVRECKEIKSKDIEYGSRKKIKQLNLLFTKLIKDYNARFVLLTTLSVKTALKKSRVKEAEFSFYETGIAITLF